MIKLLRQFISGLEEEQNEICHAARIGDATRIVQLLDQNPALIDSHCIALQTPLHLAASGGHTEVVMTLLSRGANVNAETEYHTTPLVCARRNVANVIRENGGKESGSKIFDAVAWADMLELKRILDAHAASSARRNTQDVKLLHKALHRAVFGVI